LLERIDIAGTQRAMLFVEQAFEIGEGAILFGEQAMKSVPGQ
jgi:hypothetical protein